VFQKEPFFSSSVFGERYPNYAVSSEISNQLKRHTPSLPGLQVLPWPKIEIKLLMIIIFFILINQIIWSINKYGIIKI
jgi:hypothetical protein